MPEPKKVPCPDTPDCDPVVKKHPNFCHAHSSSYWKLNRERCPATCKTGKLCKVDDAFTSPAKAERAIAGAKFPNQATNTAGALSRALALIQNRGAKGAKQIVYVITDGEPNSPVAKTAVSETTKEAEKLRKAARLIFIPVGHSSLKSNMNKWATKPSSKNVFYAKDFKVLKSKIKTAVKSTCK